MHHAIPAFRVRVRVRLRVSIRVPVRPSSSASTQHLIALFLPSPCIDVPFRGRVRGRPSLCINAPCSKPLKQLGDSLWVCGSAVQPHGEDLQEDRVGEDLLALSPNPNPNRRLIRVSGLVRASIGSRLVRPQSCSNPDHIPSSKSSPNPDPNILLAIYKSVKDRIKEAMESSVETDVEDSIGFKSNLGKFTAPRAQSSQAPLLENAVDWKVQFDVNDEGVRSRSDHSPLRLMLSLDRALVPMVSSDPCKQRQ